MNDDRDRERGEAPYREDAGRAIPGVDAGRDHGSRTTAGIGARSPSGPGGRIVFGLIVIGLGVLFTLDNLGLVPAGEVLRWWSALLIVFGLARLTGFCCGHNVTLGIIFTLAGALLLLHEMHAIAVDPWDFWPVVLIVIGGSMLNGALRRRRDPGLLQVAGTDPSATLSTFAWWAGIERKVTSTSFRGGDVTAIMGGADIDLRPARMEGGHAVLDVTVLWGGIDLYVPADWRVSVEALPLLAGIEDSTQAPAGEARGHLVVRGVVLMGGLEVKN